MSFLIPATFRTELARSLHRDIVNVNDFFYVFLGRTLEWADEPVPETQNDTRYNLAEIKRNIIGVKNITPLDAVLMAPRYDWEAGTVYASYSDVETMVGRQFYVMTNNFRIYKCLSNANSSFSTSNPSSEDPLLAPEPLSTVVEKFQTADGYWWQFMFEIPIADQVKFLTADSIPVRFYSTSTSFDYNGVIDEITITSEGTGYSEAPTVVILGDGTGATATATINLSGEVDEITVTNGGEGYSFVVVNILGDGAGAEAIASLVGVETTVDVNSTVAAYASATAGSIEFITLLDGGEGYVSNTTTVTIIGDGEGAEAAAIVAQDGTITGFTVTSSGTGYTFAEVEITSPVGVGASARALVGPNGGHGSNLPQELFATTVGISVTFQDNLEDLFIGNDFRQFGIVKNVRGIDNLSLFTDLTGRATYLLEVPDASAYLPDDNVISSSGGEFTVVSINTDTDLITLLPIIDILDESDTLENERTAVSGLVITEILESPEFNKNSGTIITVSSTAPITRQDDQAETVTLYITF